MVVGATNRFPRLCILPTVSIQSAIGEGNAFRTFLQNLLMLERHTSHINSPAVFDSRGRRVTHTTNRDRKLLGFIQRQWNLIQKYKFIPL